MADSGIVSENQIRRLAELACLSLDEPELVRVTDEIQSILRYMEQLDELDTTDVEPTGHVGDPELCLRDDVPSTGVERNVVSEQSPQWNHDGFVVPSFLGDGT